MLRRVITQGDMVLLAPNPDITAAAPREQDATPEVPLASDTYGSRLLKLIPVEVVTLFVTLGGIIRTAGNEQVAPGVYWGVFVLLLIGSYVYILRGTAVPPLPASHTQAIVSTVSFAVWVFAMGGHSVSQIWRGTSRFTVRSCCRYTRSACRWSHIDRLLSTADSTDRCNSLVESFGRCFEV